MKSVWLEAPVQPHFAPLRGDIKTDVLVIGGGMAGILTAYRLTRAGVRTVLAEARTIGGGVTQNTTAKITSQHGLIYQKLLKQSGTETARLYYEANQQALEEYARLCRSIDCDFERKDAFVYSLEDRRKLERELEALQRFGAAADYFEKLPLPFPTVGGIRFPEQAQFHPLKFISALCSGLEIYEHTAVRELLPRKAVTAHGSITAEVIVAATHFPFINKHGGYFLKMYQDRSYVLALDKAQDVHGMYIDEAGQGLSFRNYKNLLLLGGSSHRTGKPTGGWDSLTEFAHAHYPDAHGVYRWAAQDCMTLDGIPYIGQYGRNTEGFYVASGFNKWGMTSSMAAAQLLTDLITGEDNPYAELFSPRRTMLRPQLAVNAFETVTNLLTPTKKRCPHLGCALKWNPQEHSWDCPCHGSRFAPDGTLLDNPATGDTSF